MNAPHNTTPTYSIGHWLTPEQLQMLARKGSVDRPAFQVSVRFVLDASGLGSQNGRRDLVVETAKWHDEENLEVTGTLVGLVDATLITVAVAGFVATHRSGCLWNIGEVLSVN